MIQWPLRLLTRILNHRELDKKRLGYAEEIECRSEQALLRATQVIAALEKEVTTPPTKAGSF